MIRLGMGYANGPTMDHLAMMRTHAALNDVHASCPNYHRRSRRQPRRQLLPQLVVEEGDQDALPLCAPVAVFARFPGHVGHFDSHLDDVLLDFDHHPLELTLVPPSSQSHCQCLPLFHQRTIDTLRIAFRRLNVPQICRRRTWRRHGR